MRMKTCFQSEFTTMAATVVGDAAIAVRREEGHLTIPSVGGERPAVAEQHRLPSTPIFVVDLRAVLHSDRTHRGASCYMCIYILAPLRRRCVRVGARRRRRGSVLCASAPLPRRTDEGIGVSSG